MGPAIILGPRASCACFGFQSHVDSQYLETHCTSTPLAPKDSGQHDDNLGVFGVVYDQRECLSYDAYDSLTAVGMYQHVVPVPYIDSLRCNSSTAVQPLYESISQLRSGRCCSHVVCIMYYRQFCLITLSSPRANMAMGYSSSSKCEINSHQYFSIPGTVVSLVQTAVHQV